MVEELGDAEVEELHIALVGHEDVGWLEIAMDDQPDVCVRDGARNLEEELEAGANRQALGRHVLVDRAPRHVLERQIRLAVGRNAGVV